MTQFTIGAFWRDRLPGRLAAATAPRAGWLSHLAELPTFKEAPLTVSDFFASEGGDPNTSEILLISAPGAVGKSTLARQIGALTGATYVDLASADPVGGNTLSGGLVRSGLYDAWQQGEATVLLDGLDEARLRVTQEAFDAFLGDVADISAGRSLPTVLFGRTGSIHDAWLTLALRGNVSIAVLEIGYYGPEAALEFAEARLLDANPGNPHQAVARHALDLLLRGLRADTEGDGDRFAGYAPVLEAVANRVAQEGNPSALVAQIEKGDQPVTLRTVVDAILKREHQKLQSVPLEQEELKGLLYLPDEQLARLAALRYGQPPPEPPAMSAKDALAYSSALTNWVPEHPFLDGATGAASAVFDGVIAAGALRNGSTSNAALDRELAKGAAANPFLSEFYLTGGEGEFLPPDHIGVLYSSMRARLSLGDTASLTVEGADDAEDIEALKADVEISLARFGSDRPKVMHFESDQTGMLRLGAHVEDVEVSALNSRVEIGAGREAIIVAPVSIQCSHVRFSEETLIVEAAPDRPDAAVFIEAQSVNGILGAVPVVHGDVSFSVAWPGSRAHPWTSFATIPTVAHDPRVEEALRRLRKFIIAFRSHSKGSLKRFQGKIEHARMTKGTGQAVLDHLASEGVLTLHDAMYQLHPDQLASKTGASYASAMSRTFSEKAIAFVGEAIAKRA